MANVSKTHARGTQLAKGTKPGDYLQEVLNCQRTTKGAGKKKSIKASSHAYAGPRCGSSRRPRRRTHGGKSAMNPFAKKPTPRGTIHPPSLPLLLDRNSIEFGLSCRDPLRDRACFRLVAAACGESQSTCSLGSNLRALG
jgi:hypothetical protein